MRRAIGIALVIAGLGALSGPTHVASGFSRTNADVVSGFSRTNVASGFSRTSDLAQNGYNEANVEYDGRLVFVRVRYEMGYGGFGGRMRMREPFWMHDYPTADIHMMKILNELTLAKPRIDGSNILTLDDPELFNYPVIYMSEPGYWQMSDEEAKGLRNYLRKGGFIIFDDFRDEHWYNLEDQMRRVLPDGKWLPLDASHQVFHSFFEIDGLDLLTSYGPHKPEYFGMFEENDPTKRLIAIANFNNDLGEYWEFSDQGVDPVDLSNEAYKFGVNYFIYALIH